MLYICLFFHNYVLHSVKVFRATGKHGNAGTETGTGTETGKHGNSLSDRTTEPGAASESELLESKAKGSPSAREIRVGFHM